MRCPILIAISFFIFNLLGCSNSEDKSNEAALTHAVENNAHHQSNMSYEASSGTLHTAEALVLQNNSQMPVATIGNEVLNLADIDKHILLKKYDLKWSLYELRLKTLDSLINSRVEGGKIGEVSILLDPPIPPRIDIPYEHRDVFGSANSAIKVAVFCSYQSSPCMRIQPIISELQNLYGELLSVIPYDLPMPYHRYARNAANAARCAASLSLLEPFQKGLYADIDKLNIDRYTLIARQLGIDIDAFRNCYENRVFDNLIQQDIDFGVQLNTGNVPIIFINGLYTKGPKNIDTYIYYIEQELLRLGIQIEDTIKYNDNSEQNVDDFNDPNAQNNVTNDEKHIPVDSQERDVPLTAKMTLSREWLNAHLLNQSELEKSFGPAEHIVNGQYHLMRLEGTTDTDFYMTLGLEERDVIMQVNGEWLHSGQNTLWEELYSQDLVSIVVMRKGYPYRYDFEIQ